MSCADVCKPPLVGTDRFSREMVLHVRCCGSADIDGEVEVGAFPSPSPLQQRSATGQVVETMEQLTDASRRVSATAQQIAAAAGTLADLAGNLEATAATTRERY